MTLTNMLSMTTMKSPFHCFVALIPVLLPSSAATATDPYICRLLPTAHLELRGNGHTQTHAWDCARVAGSGPKEIKLGSIDLDNVDPWKESLFFSLDEYTSDIDFLENARLLSEDQVESLIETNTRTLLRGDKSMNTMRRTVTTTGARDCGIVIVNARNKHYKENTVQELEAILYEDSSTQFESCSKDDLWLVKKDTTIEVDLPKTLGSYNRDTVYDAARKAVCQHYRLENDCEPATARGLDHILYVLPFGLRDDVENSFWGYADVGGVRGYSIYGSRFFKASTILHE